MNKSKALRAMMLTALHRTAASGIYRITPEQFLLCVAEIDTLNADSEVMRAVDLLRHRAENFERFQQALQYFLRLKQGEPAEFDEALERAEERSQAAEKTELTLDALVEEILEEPGRNVGFALLCEEAELELLRAELEKEPQEASSGREYSDEELEALLDRFMSMEDEEIDKTMRALAPADLFRLGQLVDQRQKQASEEEEIVRERTDEELLQLLDHLREVEPGEMEELMGALNPADLERLGELLTEQHPEVLEEDPDRSYTDEELWALWEQMDEADGDEVDRVLENLPAADLKRLVELIEEKREDLLTDLAEDLVKMEEIAEPVDPEDGASVGKKAESAILTLDRMMKNGDYVAALSMMQEMERPVAMEIVTMMLQAGMLDEDAAEQLRYALGGEDALQQESEEIKAPRETGKLSDFLADVLGAELPETEMTEPDDTERVMADKTEGADIDGVTRLVTRVNDIRTKLLGKVFGQEHAVDVCVTGLFNAEFAALTGHETNKPRATFLFAGPPGVGKTYLAESMAELMGLPYLRVDMSEFGNYHGSERFRNVLQFVKEKPKSVILFDEIEKANGDVINLFLQILDAGRGGEAPHAVSFAETYLFFTTNVGRGLYEGTDQTDLSGNSRKVILRALEQEINPQTRQPMFPAAICSRFATGNVVMFNHLPAHQLCRIAKDVILRRAEGVAKKMNLQAEFDPAVFSTVLFAQGGRADGRTVTACANAFFEGELYELFRMVHSKAEDKKIGNIRRVRFTLEMPEDEELRQLYVAEEKMKVLMFADSLTGALQRPACNKCEILTVDNIPQMEQMLATEPVKLVLCDISYGFKTSDYLNTEDRNSRGRDCFKKLREEYPGLPVYLLHDGLSDEEKVSFTREGARGYFEKSALHQPETMAALDEIALQLHQQESMYALASTNRMVDYETAQRISEDGESCEIRIFDLCTRVNVDAEDRDSVLSALEKPDVSFADVIGAKDAKEELQFFVNYLRDPKAFRKSGTKAPKGVLLYGPPGTGKTMLAKAMANESGVTFIASEGNAFLKKWVGEGPQKVHELFATARKYAPAIIFVDEIDVIGKERSGDDGTGYKPDDILTAFLAEMDGFAANPDKPVFVLAATNYSVEAGNAKSLDGALLRRFDRRILVDLPDKEERLRYLKLRTEKDAFFKVSEAQLESLAARSAGMSPALLEGVLEMAKREALKDGASAVDDNMLDRAFETYNSGEEKTWNPDQLERVAYHEAGHALLSWLAGDKPTYITIVARGNHGGYMQHGDNEGKAIFTKDELLARIRTSLGGRAAELLHYGDKDGVTTGASGDLASATELATHLVCSYGMDADFGLAVISPDAAYKGGLAEEIRATVNDLLQEQLTRAIGLLQEHQNKLEAMVDRLLDCNHLTAEKIEQIFAEN